MAVGDIVSGITGGGVGLSFQPAAGVECVLTSAGGYTGWTRFSNGVTVSLVSLFNSPDYQSNVKYCVNNTIYLTIDANANGCAFSGIQIK